MNATPFFVLCSLKLCGQQWLITVYLTLHILDVIEAHGDGKPKAANEKSGLASDSVDALTDEAQKQFDRFVQGAHQMTACALAAIDACSADVPQTVQILELMVLRPHSAIASL